MGGALTNKVSGWFENTFHFDSYMYTEEKTGRQRSGVRAFFERHLDPEVPNVWWPAKLGVEPETAARVRALFSNDYVPLLLNERGESECDLRKVFEIMDEQEIREKVERSVVA
jgi:hypothetical protein